MNKFVLFVILCIFICSCTKDDPPTSNEVDQSIPYVIDPIFPNTVLIKVPVYTYFDNLTSKTYTVHGTSGDIVTADTAIVVDYFDTVSGRPSFAWAKTHLKYVVAAIFNRRIQINTGKNEIGNPQDIVWVWNTGMSSGQEGAIGFSDGCNLTDGVIQYNKKPAPLDHDSNYVWAIWAWNSETLEIIYSSREIPFHVE
jgi:hypothetical protein